jgi:hypothetical protein
MTISLRARATNHTRAPAKASEFYESDARCASSSAFGALLCAEEFRPQWQKRQTFRERSMFAIRLTFSPRRVIKCARPPKSRFLGLATRFRSCRAAVRAVRLGRVGVQDD